MMSQDPDITHIALGVAKLGFRNRKKMDSPSAKGFLGKTKLNVKVMATTQCNWETHAWWETQNCTEILLGSRSDGLVGSGS